MKPGEDSRRQARFRRPLKPDVRASTLEVPMRFDEDKIDRTILALLYLTLHEKNALGSPSTGTR
jgi:hypothetical protein